MRTRRSEGLVVIPVRKGREQAGRWEGPNHHACSRSPSSRFPPLPSASPPPPKGYGPRPAAIHLQARLLTASPEGIRSPTSHEPPWNDNTMKIKIQRGLFMMKLSSKPLPHLKITISQFFRTRSQPSPQSCLAGNPEDGTLKIPVGSGG